MAKSKIIKDLANGSVDLHTSLKRTKILLEELGNPELLRWVNNEIEGYLDNDQLPSYRIINGQLYGSYNIYTASNFISYEDTPMRLGNIPEDIRVDILTKNVIEGIMPLTNILSDLEKSGKPYLIKFIPADCYQYLAKAYNDHIEIVAAYVHLNMTEIYSIFSTVENKLLDILCYLEKQFGQLDALDININEKSENDLTTIVNIVGDFIYTNNKITIGDNNKIKNSQIVSSVMEKQPDTTQEKSIRKKSKSSN